MIRTPSPVGRRGYVNGGMGMGQMDRFKLDGQVALVGGGGGAIGGAMAQLDKTFPTNDCSM